MAELTAVFGDILGALAKMKASGDEDRSRSCKSECPSLQAGMFEVWEAKVDHGLCVSDPLALKSATRANSRPEVPLRCL